MTTDCDSVLGLRLLKISAVYLVLGLAVGLGMGISQSFVFASVHAHTLLLGWAAMAVCGIIYLLLPGCPGNRLRVLHFWGHNLGLPVMIAGLTLEARGNKSVEPMVAGGSVLVFFSLLLFTLNLLRHRGPRQRES